MKSPPKRYLRQIILLCGLPFHFVFETELFALFPILRNTSIWRWTERLGIWHYREYITQWGLAIKYLLSDIYMQEFEATLKGEMDHLQRIQCSSERTQNHRLRRTGDCHCDEQRLLGMPQGTEPRETETRIWQLQRDQVPLQVFGALSKVDLQSNQRGATAQRLGLHRASSRRDLHPEDCRPCDLLQRRCDPGYLGLFLPERLYRLGDF